MVCSGAPNFGGGFSRTASIPIGFLSNDFFEDLWFSGNLGILVDEHSDAKTGSTRAV
jgi:hypothetical protein